MNAYLQGAYAPVRDELTAFDLPITGELPAELDGRYLRNGPNPLLAPDPERYHWFTGDGMVHGVRLRDGHAEWFATASSAAPPSRPRSARPRDRARCTAGWTSRPTPT